MKAISILLATLLLSACASKPPAPSNKCGKACQEWLNR